MATIVFVHAHPDDESSSTGGSIARAAARGDRCVTVFATNGDHGEVPDDLGDESLVSRRRREAEAAAAILGTAAVHWLGYADSGMSGWEQNDHEAAFVQVDVDVAARQLADILDREQADVVTGYDWHGNYGHPDHVQVHRVVRRAVELTAQPVRLLEVTANRTLWVRMAQEALSRGYQPPLDPADPADDGNPIGTPESELQWLVDVRDHLDTKLAALARHASQATDLQLFMSLPEEVRTVGFGQEFYLEPGLDQPMTAGWPFDER